MMKQTSLYRYFRSVGRSVSSKEPYFDYTSLYEHGDIDGNYGYESQFFDCTLVEYNAAITAEFHTTPMERERNKYKPLSLSISRKYEELLKLGLRGDY